MKINPAAWRNSADTQWLADAPVHPLQQALKDLERAYRNFFAKRADFPRFKKKGQSDSFRYPDPKQIKLDQANSRLFLPKLRRLRQAVKTNRFRKIFNRSVRELARRMNHHGKAQNTGGQEAP